MKRFNETTAVLLSLAVALAAWAANEAPRPAAVPVPAQSHPVNEVDEIAIEDFDDSAVAAKGRPVVTLAPAPSAGEEQAGKADKVGQKTGKAEKAAEKIVKDEKAAEKIVKAEKVAEKPGDSGKPRQTGAEIAAKYLAANESALVDIVSDDATLTDILRQFRKATGANIIYAESSNLQQRVSVSLRHVPWLKAMGSILNSRGFRVESSGGIHFVKEDKAKDPTFTRSFVLNHSSADELAKLFNDSYGIKSPDGKVTHHIATAFQGANTVVVNATERILADCEKIVNAVDKAVPQIYIEARFIELSNEALHKLGVQWNQLESWGASVKDLSGGMSYGNDRAKGLSISHDKGLSITDGASNSKSTSKSSGVTDNVLSSSSSSSLSDSSNHSSSRTSDSTRNGTSTSDSSYSRAFSGQLSVDDFQLALSAFETMSDVKIFSNPKIIVSNGKEAKVDMTTKFPNVKIQATRNTSSGSDSLDISTQLEVIPGEDKLLFAKEAFFSWGITLSVKPRISPDGLISVEIIPQISQLDTSVVMDNDQTPNGFIQVKGGDSSAMSYYPVIEVKRLTTDFTMKDGATAVIGGLSKTTEEDVDSGIPYLREIPWIGNKLFGWKSRGKVQKEIIVFVTVGIADPADLQRDVGLPKNAVMGREYVERRLLEPGDRPDAAADAMKLDMRPVDSSRLEKGKSEKSQPANEGTKPESENRGTVTITPVEAAAIPTVPVRETGAEPYSVPESESDKVNISPVI